MKNFFLKSIYLSILLSAFLSCSDTDENITQSNDQPNVYIGGSERLASVVTYAKIWKNGVGSNLSSGINDCYVNSVFVSENNDVYAVGQNKIWKNGIESSLQYLDSNTDLYGVSVLGDDVYVVGNSNNETNLIPIIWKNGNPTVLSNNGNSGSCSSIFISNNDIYVCGEVNGMARVWKNNQNYLTTNDGSFDSVYVSGNDVYVCGVSSNGKATIWKNGTPTNLPTENETISSVAISIFVKENDVYAVGTSSSQQNGSWITKGILWKNGVMTILPSFNQNGGVVYANSIFVYENDVYIVGHEGHPTNPIGAVLWKNGVINQLSSNTLSDATSVYIK